MIYSCTKCDSQFPKWQGKCPECGAWGTIHESAPARTQESGKAKSAPAAPQTRIGSITQNTNTRFITKLQPVDTVCGGGLVQGSLVLLGGEPGIGKSTLVLQIAQSYEKEKKTVLYLAGEESPAQIKQRAERLQLTLKDMGCVTSTNIDAVATTIQKEKPDLVVIDSIQTVWTNDAEGSPGGTAQVRACTTKLLQLAKETGSTIIIIGHVTKDGSVAGPKTLEHLVDVVLYIEGKRLQALRLLRSIKNRFGPSGEVGVMLMEKNGLVPAKNVEQVFLQANQEAVGSVIGATVDGSQVFFSHIHVLLEKSAAPYPRRVVMGTDSNRLAVLLAIIHRYLKIQLAGYDIYVQIPDGVKKHDPHFDLALCAALVSAYREQQPPERMIFTGEVSLNGSVRSLGDEVKIIREAAQLQFKAVVCGAAQKKATSKQIAITHMQGVGELDGVFKKK